MFKSLVLSAIWALTLLALVEATNKVGHPIAIVPGIIGTSLHAIAKNIPEGHMPAFCPRNHKDFTIWFNPTFDFNLKCFRFYLRTNYAVANNTWEDTPGVTFYVPKEGTTYAMDILDADSTKLAKYFHNFITAFEEHGYQDGINMTGCGYDWRHLPTPEWANKCRGFIEKMVQSSGKKAILIGHSMGGPYSYYLLRTAPDGWVEKYIFKYVTASPAWMGAPRALDAMFSGLGPFVPSVIGNLFAPLSRSIAGVWFLLPWTDAFKGVPAVNTPKNSYSYDEMPKILDLLGLPDPYLKYDSTRAVFNPFNNYDFMPNIPMITVYATDLDTIHTLVFNEELSKHDPEADWEHPDGYIHGPGDGTVPEVSMNYVRDKWMKMYPDRNITYVRLHGADHHHVILDPPFTNLLLDEAFNDY